MFLLADIGRPQALLGLLASPFASLVSLGAWIMMLSALVSVALAVLLVMNRAKGPMLVALEAAGGVLSVAALVYTGLLLSTMPSVDFWNTWLLVVLFVISGVTCGIAATEGVCIALGGPLRHPERQAGAHGAGAVVEAVALAALLISRWLATEPARASVERLLAGDCSGAFLGGVVLVGIAAPLACLVLRRAGNGKALALAAAACTLIGGLALRWCVVNAAVVEEVALGPLFM